MELLENYRIIDIANYKIDIYEQLGTKSKFWCYEQTDSHEENIGEVSYLFKSIKTQDRYGAEIYRFGEDWAEKIACELAKKLGIPCAEYELAINGDDFGVITRKFTSRSGDRLVTGNEILYLEREGRTELASNMQNEIPVDEVPQDILHVFSVCENLIVKKPNDYNSYPMVKSASDFMVGYLLLDALISNQDRHSQNWGMIQGMKNNVSSGHLAPTFDHAASLGRNESREFLIDRLTTKDKYRSIDAYVKKAKSYFYLDGVRLKTKDAFYIFSLRKKEAAKFWIDKMNGLSNDDIWRIIHAVPSERMSFYAKLFAFEVIKCNRAQINLRVAELD